MDSITRIKEFIRVNFPEWKKVDYSEFDDNIDFRTDMSELYKIVDDEVILISYTNISITGSERPKPQLRVFLDEYKKPFYFAKKHQLRYYLFSIFTKEDSMARGLDKFNPKEYVISIETNLDIEGSRRDLRSIYDYANEKLNGRKFLKCSRDDYKVDINEASFIYIGSPEHPYKDGFENFINIFDSRPYLNSTSDILAHIKETRNSDLPLQKIFYGAPGTGKSHTVDTEYVKGNKCFRITFHPDTDYASFVGCYKPKMGGDTGEDITYSFVPQIFLNAYTYAWNHPDEPTYLVIEELNRGNCAQIFGDIFQLLDRQKTVHPGYSKYTINADSDIATYLSGELKDKESYEKVIREIYGPKEFDFSILALSSNLNILATMNTSDQSLFPIDSAFKRRWGMEYVGVNYTDAEQFSVKIDDAHKYSWADILKGMNRYIKQEKHSTNKILGNRFVQADENNVFSSIVFRDKVLFFLFNDVFKDEDEFRTSFFGGNDTLYFEDLCEGDDWTTYVINFIEKTCGASNKSNTQQVDEVTPQQAEKESTTETE